MTKHPIKKINLFSTVKRIYSYTTATTTNGPNYSYF